jgi:catechol 2,3-dioxygenase-like lactoylglutathione lyase family enzyme
MRGLALFAAGLILGISLMQPTAAQESKSSSSSGIKLNHVGMNVKNFEETLNFYKTIGVREGFTLRDAEGKPTLAYIQISRETFLELAQATPERPAGITHFGLQADNVNTTIMKLRQAGVKVDDAKPSRTNTLLTAAFDPNGIRFEMAELTPESLPKKAMDAWK